MALPTIFSAISTISSALKIVEFAEDHGFLPTGGELTSLNLEIASEQPSLRAAATQISVSIGDAEDELFKDTEGRVAECLRSLNKAMGDPDYLPDQRRRLGIAARKCICREVDTIRDLNAGNLPKELERLWGKYKCAEIDNPQLLTA